MVINKINRGRFAMPKALFMGSFNPLTYGHLNIIERAASLFDDLVVGIAVNAHKSQALFSPEEVEDMLAHTTAHIANVEIKHYQGLTADFAKMHKIQVIIRALRSVQDFDAEYSHAWANLQLSGLQTLVLFGDPQFSAISSTLVKEIAFFGGDLSCWVPSFVENRVKEKIKTLKSL